MGGGPRHSATRRTHGRPWLRRRRVLSSVGPLAASSLQEAKDVVRRDRAVRSPRRQGRSRASALSVPPPPGAAPLLEKVPDRPRQRLGGRPSRAAAAPCSASAIHGSLWQVLLRERTNGPERAGAHTPARRRSVVGGTSTARSALPASEPRCIKLRSGQHRRRSAQARIHRLRPPGVQEVQHLQAYVHYPPSARS